VNHIDPESKAVLVRSRDNGKTWGEKTVIYRDEDGIQDPSLMQLKDGTLLSNFFKWRIRKTKEELEGFGQVSPYHLGGWAADIGTYVVRSSDNGYTWDKSPAHFEIPGYKAVSTSAPPLECNDGTILLPAYAQPVVENGVMIKSASSFVIKSFDKGKTWVEPTLVAVDPEGKVALEEPTLVQLKSGKIICMMRADSGGGDYLREAESFYNGKTWTAFWKTPIIGHPPHLLQLSDGRILCTYGYRHPPFGIRACI